MTLCIEYELPYNSEEEYCMYLANHDNDKKIDEEQEINVPLRVTIRVTVALCGLFLSFVPIPICKAWGPELVKTGLAWL